MRNRKPEPPIIDFQNIDRPSIPYSILRFYVYYVFRYIYYRQFDVVNVQNFPKSDVPTLIVSNHQNGLNDALVVLMSVPDLRQPVFIARGDLFRRKIVAKMLRFLKIMPAFRVMDGDDPTRNDVIFDISASVLQNKHTLTMFPEAGHEDCHRLGYFRKGFARMAFKAEEHSDFKLGLKILPVANHYSGYFNFREKVALVIGDPVDISEYIPLYKENPEKAMLDLARRMRNDVSNLMLNIEEKEDYHKYNFLRVMTMSDYVKKMGWKESYFPNTLKASKIIVEKLESLKEKNSDKLNELLDKADKMVGGINELRLKPWLFEKRITLKGLIGRTSLFVILFPLYVIYYLLNILPFKAPNLINKRVKDEMLHSSFAFGLSALVVFPLTYLIYIILIGIIGNTTWLTALFLFTLIPGLVFFNAYRKGFKKLRGRWRFYRLRRKENSKFMELENIYKELIVEMNKILYS
jgi:1-acyl-sn-glycerol-3-phosphate acyltransferase